MDRDIIKQYKVLKIFFISLIKKHWSFTSANKAIKKARGKYFVDWICDYVSNEF